MLFVEPNQGTELIPPLRHKKKAPRREPVFYGGAGGIRTPDIAFQPYIGLANRRLKPLGHPSKKTQQLEF